MTKKIEQDFKTLLISGYDFVKSLKFILDSVGWSLSRVAAEAGVDGAVVSRAIRADVEQPTAAMRRARYVNQAALGFDPWAVFQEACLDVCKRGLGLDV